MLLEDCVREMEEGRGLTCLISPFRAKSKTRKSESVRRTPTAPQPKLLALERFAPASGVGAHDSTKPDRFELRPNSGGAGSNRGPSRLRGSRPAATPRCSAAFRERLRSFVRRRGVIGVGLSAAASSAAALSHCVASAASFASGRDRPAEPAQVRGQWAAAERDRDLRAGSGTELVVGDRRAQRRASESRARACSTLEAPFAAGTHDPVAAASWAIRLAP
jgi:hypothetical protein